MPSAQKRRVLEKTRKREGRGRVYLLATVIIIIVVGVGTYSYVSAQSANMKTANPGTVYAKLNTSNGTIEVVLYGNSAPKTVANFVNLANSGFYTMLVWHRILKTGPAIIQTGDPYTKNGGGDRASWGTGVSSPTVPLEIDRSLHNTVGYLAMARLGGDVNSGSCQFYINLSDNTYLDGQYTVFGKVINGLNVANTIQNTPVDSPTHGQPINPVFLTSVTISSIP
jgi:cyclophilin family peptidyl-prolyl cis-trans isomerase